MPVFTIEMLWDCPQCKAERNLGLDKHCRNCGHPKTDHSDDYMPDNVSVKDALDGDKRRRAEAGPDWKCGFCESLQSKLNLCCTDCGGPQNGAKPWTAKVEESTFDPFAGFKIETHEVPVEPPNPHVGDAPVPKPTNPPGTEIARSSIRVESRPMLGVAIDVTTVLIAVVAMFGLGLGGWLIFRTKVHDVKVQGLSWEHKIEIERYQVMHREGWAPDLQAFDQQYVGAHIHHYDHVRVGSHTEHYSVKEQCGQDCRTIPGSCSTTPVRCKSQNNSAAICQGGDRVCSADRQSCTTKYCDPNRTKTVDDYESQPRFANWYAWSVWDWAYNRQLVHSGISTVESWPEGSELEAPLKPGEKERIARRSATHQVQFSDAKGDTWSITPDACQEFAKYPVGGAWSIKVGVAHGIDVFPR